MVICYFNFIGRTVVPFEYYSPLIVDAYAVKIFQATRQLFKAVCGRYSKVGNILRIIYHSQFSSGYMLNFERQTFHTFSAPYSFRLF